VPALPDARRSVRRPRRRVHPRRPRASRPSPAETVRGFESPELHSAVRRHASASTSIRIASSDLRGSIRYADVARVWEDFCLRVLATVPVPEPRALAQDELRACRPGGHGRPHWKTEQARAGRQVGLFLVVRGGRLPLLPIRFRYRTHDRRLAGRASDLEEDPRGGETRTNPRPWKASMPLSRRRLVLDDRHVRTGGGTHRARSYPPRYARHGSAPIICRASHSTDSRTSPCSSSRLAGHDHRNESAAARLA
jgi:hypothetical protein